MLIDMNTRLFRMLAAAIPQIRHYLILMSHNETKAPSGVVIHTEYSYI